MVIRVNEVRNPFHHEKVTANGGIIQVQETLYLLFLYTFS